MAGRERRGETVSLVEHTIFGKTNKVKTAINRIKTYSDISYQLTGKPYYVAYSGGKDSDVIRILCILANVPFELHHNHTTADAPETVYYIRTMPEIQIHYPAMSMWELIPKTKMPPTRMVRYCCSHLKEGGGKDRFVITGVRWAESKERKESRTSLEIQGGKKKNNIILNADNSEHRREFETCIKQGKRILNPIIDWTDDDVWEFLDHVGCESNPLYAEGYKRVGCVGCPMADIEKELLRWPKFKSMYISAFDRMVNNRTVKEKDYENGYGNWTSGEAVYDWWVKKNRVDKMAGQLEIEE